VIFAKTIFIGILLFLNVYISNNINVLQIVYNVKQILITVSFAHLYFMQMKEFVLFVLKFAKLVWLQEYVNPVRMDII